MNKNEQTAIMYETIPAVAELNKVPGFNPMRLLRRITSPENGEEMMQLDLRYKKLWFRLANPKGRIRLNALRITEQMAIYEAQIFLERTDENPIGSFTSSCSKEEAPGGQYIQAAQQAAMDEALSDAGFGIQFADVGIGGDGRRYGSREVMCRMICVTSGRRNISVTRMRRKIRRRKRNLFPGHTAESPV